MFRKIILCLLLFVFCFTHGVGPDGRVLAQNAGILPEPGIRLALSPVFEPPLLKGIKVYRNAPFRFDFILDKGDIDNGVETQNLASLRRDSTRLIKYFLAALTVPEKDLWVNLSPYEKDRIIPEAFGQTEMGRDLLAQDYILKQITASVIDPNTKVGKEFWDKVYAESFKRYGTTDIPIDTFNKVWITPAKASVYENKDAAVVVDATLKVMLEADYLAIARADTRSAPTTHGDTLLRVGEDLVSSRNDIPKQILREIIIPILEKEVNEGKNFIVLRQVYNSLILAAWYKRKVKASVMGQGYIDQNKILGIDITDKNEKEKIWNRYVEAFRKGAYNFIREEYDPVTRESMPRKYFSGGFKLGIEALTEASSSKGVTFKQPLLMRTDGKLQVENAQGTSKDASEKIRRIPVDAKVQAVNDLVALRNIFPEILGKLSTPKVVGDFVDDFLMEKPLYGERVAVMKQEGSNTFVVGGLDRALLDNLKLPFMSIAGVVELTNGKYVLLLRAAHKRQPGSPTLPGGYGQFSMTPEDNVLAEMRDELDFPQAHQFNSTNLELVKVVEANLAVDAPPEVCFLYRYKATQAETDVILTNKKKSDTEKRSLFKADYDRKLKAWSQRESGKGETAGYYLINPAEIKPGANILIENEYGDGVVKEKKGFAVPLELFAGIDAMNSLTFLRTNSTEEAYAVVHGDNDNEIKVTRSFSKEAANYIFMDADNFVWKGHEQYFRLLGEMYYRAKNNIPLDKELVLTDVDLNEGMAWHRDRNYLMDPERISEMLKAVQQPGVIPVNTRQQYEQFFQEHFDAREAVLMDGVGTFFTQVERLREQGYEIHLFLLSHSSEFQVQKKTAYLGIADKFDHVFAIPWDYDTKGISSATFKTRQVVEAVKAYAGDKEVFVALGGDKESDMRAAQGAAFLGVPTSSFGVPFGTSTEKMLQEAGAMVIVPSLADAPTIFLSLTSDQEAAVLKRDLEDMIESRGKTNEVKKVVVYARDDDLKYVEQGISVSQMKVDHPPYVARFLRHINPGHSLLSDPQYQSAIAQDKAKGTRISLVHEIPSHVLESSEGYRQLVGAIKKTAAFKNGKISFQDEQAMHFTWLGGLESSVVSHK